MDDAALLRPESGPGLVFTVDFITPVVDEPEAFGAIAAANALSDVYAMGGEPMVALAVAGFPDEKLERSVLERIFRGGRDKCAEAGCAIAGDASDAMTSRRAVPEKPTTSRASPRRSPGCAR